MSDFDTYSMNNLLAYTKTENRELPVYNTRNLIKIFKMYDNNVVFSFMVVFASVYLSSQALQCSSLITSDAHNTITSTSYVYNLLFSMLVSYFLFTYSQIRSNKKPSILSYWFFSTFGALGFALLGEISWLKHIAITKGWMHKLTPSAFIVVTIFTIVILLVGIREYYTKLQFQDKCRSFVKISSVLGFYFALFLILNANDATDIHYHVHHAIFSGILSLWFIDWDNYFEMIVHSICMGIVIEGIDFYGIQELFLLLFKDNSVGFDLSLIIAFVYLLPMLALIYVFYYKK